MKNENYAEFDNTLDGLMEFFESLPQATVKILNFERYSQMLRAAAKLAALLQKENPEGSIDIEIIEKFSIGAISAELDDLTVYSPKVFADITKDADNFEIYPLTNGKIRLDITFHRVLKAVM